MNLTKKEKWELKIAQERKETADRVWEEAFLDLLKERCTIERLVSAMTLLNLADHTLMTLEDRLKNEKKYKTIYS